MAKATAAPEPEFNLSGAIKAAFEKLGRDASREDVLDYIKRAHGRDPHEGTSTATHPNIASYGSSLSTIRGKLKGGAESRGTRGTRAKTEDTEPTFPEVLKAKELATELKQTPE